MPHSAIPAHDFTAGQSNSSPAPLSPTLRARCSADAVVTRGGPGGRQTAAGVQQLRAGTQNLSIHPLPVLDMSEHHTRFRSQAGHEDVQVYGILLGTQQGRDVDLNNSFEIVLSDDKHDAGESSAGPGLDQRALKTRQEQFKQVFPSFEIMGWYSSGTEPDEKDMSIHKQLLSYIENLIFLKLCPSQLQQPQSSEDPEQATAIRRGDDDLPLYAFETVLEVAARPGEGKDADESLRPDGAEDGPEAMNVLWSPCAYRIETGEAERIAVDHVSKPASTGTGEETTLIANLTTQAVAQYVALVQRGAFPRDHETLRQFRALVSCLPVVGMPELKDKLIEEYNDVLLMSYLSNLTQQATSLNELVDKVDLTQEPSGSGGAFGGMSGVLSRRLPRMVSASLGGPGSGAGASNLPAGAGPLFSALGGRAGGLVSF
ncbi:hypothetical protein V8E36_006312 [Tilletia maclaganii]